MKIINNDILKIISVIIPLVGMGLGYLYVQNKNQEDALLKYNHPLMHQNSEGDTTLISVKNMERLNNKVNTDSIKNILNNIIIAYQEKNPIVREWLDSIIDVEIENRLNMNNRKSENNLIQIYHTVKKGETLFSIAKRYKVSYNLIMKYNNLESEEIEIGQKLIIYQ